MRWVTYLIYIIAWEAMVLGGSVYLHVWMERSGWWVVLGLLMSSAAYKPSHWISGKEPE